LTAPLYCAHPDFVATKATIFGMTPAPPARCRVLELGCGTGVNLLAMAQALPESRFVGIDLSPGQIASGRAVAEALGLRNIRLTAQSILDVDDSFGAFDYIICHGVYSWVPPQVQDRILAICQRHLAPQGVAYVSYNTYPGWHLRGVLRDLLVFHARRFSTVQARLQEAQPFLGFLAEAQEGATGIYGRVLASEVGRLRTQAESYVFHEYLEADNQPVYFHQFVERAAAKGLQYLDEAPIGRPPAIVARAQPFLNELPDDPILHEQYCDFLCGRSFRCTLLCHARVALRRPPSPQAVQTMHVVTKLRPTAPDSAASTVRQFSTASGVTMSTNNSIVGAALDALVRTWPQALPFRELWRQVQAAEPLGVVADPGQLAAALLQCYMAGVVELHVHPPAFSGVVSDRPRASGIARFQADSSDRVTTLRQYCVDLDPVDRFVLQRLDGTRDRAMLVAALEEAVATGELVIMHADQPVSDADTRRQVLEQALESCLCKLAGNALLVA
jgi:methyltransferase-like protein/ubiquinone/menaquinone biosynthesis C-methylase UbiE